MKLSLPGFRGGKPAEDDARRCTATTKAGTRCENYALVDDTLCVAHRKAADIASEAEAERLQFTYPEPPTAPDKMVQPERTAAMIKADEFWTTETRPTSSDFTRYAYPEEGTPIDMGGVPPEDDGRDEPVIVGLEQPGPEWFIADGRWTRYVRITRAELEAREAAAQAAGMNAILPARPDPEVEAVDAVYGTGTRRKPVGKIKSRRTIAQLLFPSVNVKSFDALDPRRRVLDRARRDPEYLMQLLAAKGKTLRPAEIAHLLPRTGFFQQAIRNHIERENASRERAAQMTYAAEDARHLAAEYFIETGQWPSTDTSPHVEHGFDRWLRERGDAEAE